MKCLTDKEFQVLLEKQGAHSIEHRQIEFPKSDHKLRVSMPEKVTPLNFFSWYLADWLTDKGEGVIYLSQWGNMDLAHPMAVFEKIRGGYGETRHLIEAPAHLFDISNEQEKTIMTGMMFLVMANDWDGYFYSRGS